MIDAEAELRTNLTWHCMKSVQIRSYFWSVFSRIRTEYGDLFKYGVISGPYFPVFGLNTGKYGPEITPYLDTYHAVWQILFYNEFLVTSFVSTVQEKEWLINYHSNFYCLTLL